jgi:hypothetical protein
MNSQLPRDVAKEAQNNIQNSPNEPNQAVQTA